jgi:hypothetical protein
MPECTDVSLRGLLAGAAIVLGGIALSLAAAALVTLYTGAPASGPNAAAPPKIEGARLQTAAPEDLRSYLREKEGRLAGYGRVDAGHVHIPIERAMRIIAEGRER